MSDPLKIIVPVAGSHPLQIPGRYVYYRKATAGVDNPQIKVTSDKGESVALLPGEGFTFTEKFGSVLVTNFDAVNSIEGFVVITDGGQFQANRVTGDVNVIDAGKSVTLSNAAFMLKGTGAGTVGEYAHIQLLNPSGSTIRGILKNIVPSAYTTSGGTGLFHVRRYDTPLTNSANGANKNIGGAASVCQVRNQTSASALGSDVFSELYFSAPNALAPFKLSEPIVLGAGEGIVVIYLITNVLAAATFEWTEEAV